MITRRSPMKFRAVQRRWWNGRGAVESELSRCCGSDSLMPGWRDAAAARIAAPRARFKRSHARRGRMDERKNGGRNDPQRRVYGRSAAGGSRPTQSGRTLRVRHREARRPWHPAGSERHVSHDGEPRPAAVEDRGCLRRRRDRRGPRALRLMQVNQAVRRSRRPPDGRDRNIAQVTAEIAHSRAG